MTHVLAGLLALLFLTTAGRAQSPVDAGQLLEQQRRLEQQQNPPAAPRDPLLGKQRETLAPDDAAGATQVTVRQFLLQGNTLLPDAALQTVLQPWLMRPVTLAGLRQAAAAIEQTYREAGWLVHVSLPPQDLTEGTLRLQIAEARLGTVQVAAGSTPPRLSARVEAILSAQLAAGEPLNLVTLERALLLAEELPGVTLAGSLQASGTPGATDVLVQVVPSPLLRGDASLDNGANRSTGSERISASLRVDAPWGWGEQFNLAASQTRGTSYLRLGASAPVGLSGWRFGVNGSALRYRVLDAYDTTTGLAPKGHSETLAVEASYPLMLGPRARWNANLSLEQKRQLNRDDDQTAGVLHTTGRARSRSVNIGITGQALDNLGRGGQTAAGVTLVAGRLDHDGSPASRLLGDALTENTQGSYRLLRWNAARLQTLTPDLSLAASASGQFASRNLNSNEKLYLGGLGGVNAYPNGEAGGSTGQLVNLELRQQLGARWQLSAFYDWGQVRQYRDNERADGKGPLSTGNRITLQGAGLSVAWRSESGLRLKATYAHRIGNNPLATANGSDSDGSLHKNRIWLTAGITF